MYFWRNKREAAAREAAVSGEALPAAEEMQLRLRQENGRLKRALADKSLEVDFFKGALHKIAARRQSRGNSGETASMTKSGK